MEDFKCGKCNLIEVRGAAFPSAEVQEGVMQDKAQKVGAQC